MNTSRRRLLVTGLAGGAQALRGQETYDTHAKGLRIAPGQWRPHYPWEHIVWISPSWPSQDYIWLDFPEAIFSSQGLLYLSHVNPAAPTVFADLPRVEWRPVPGGLAFDRRLPNGVSFGGSVVRKSAAAAELELHLHNGSAAGLNRISLQTCAYLRGIREFAAFTRDNKFVHLPSGWARLTEALSAPVGQPAPYRAGWRTSGRPVVDQPVMICVSSEPRRLVAMTWHKDTLSLIGNPNHPCLHADPKFKDLAPGERASIRGHIVFFEGGLDEFDPEKELRPLYRGE